MRNTLLSRCLVVCLVICFAVGGAAYGQDTANDMPPPASLLLPAADWGDAMDIRLALAQSQPSASGASSHDQAGMPAGTPFARGTWTFQTYGSATVWASPDTRIYTAHIGAGYHVRDRISINFDVIAGAADPTDPTKDHTGVGGFDLLLRWHFLADDDWSLYLDGGGGFQWSGDDYPSDSRHNFRPQLGIGATVRVLDDARLMAGIRWLHISNAYTSKINNGLDAAQIYAGVMVPF